MSTRRYAAHMQMAKDSKAKLTGLRVTGCKSVTVAFWQDGDKQVQLRTIQSTKLK